MPDTNEVPLTPPPPPPPPPTWGQYVIPTLTSDAQAYIAGRHGVIYATYASIPDEPHALRVYAGGGRPDVWERIQHQILDHDSGLRYVFLGLEEAGRPVYGWVRERVSSALFDFATGTFWEIDNLDRYSEESPPALTNYPVTFDSWTIVRASAMDQYIAQNLSGPEVYATVYLGTTSGVPLRRWNATDEIWDTIEEVVDRVYYKDKGTWKEYHVLLKLVGRNVGGEGSLYSWVDSSLQNPYLYTVTDGTVYEAGNVPMFWGRCHSW